MWRGDVQGIKDIKGIESERDIKGIKDIGLFKNLKIKGVKTVNFTGGEPLLREDLPELLQEAKRWNFTTQLTTNGILYEEKAELLNGLIDRLYFSLDYPVAEEHDRSRGVDCYTEVIKGIRLSRELGQKPIISFTMTRDSVRFLPEMAELAEKLGVYLYPNPVYDFYGTQGFEAATVDHIRYFRHKKNVLINYAALEFVKAGGNKVIFPRCRARETTVTVLPDGRTVSPCFYNPGGRQGREAVCSSCMRWDYMLPSFTTGFDKYRGLDLYSKLEARKKGVSR